jgi:hypothetical protein
VVTADTDTAPAAAVSDTRGLVAHVELPGMGDVHPDALERLRTWTIEATILLDRGVAGGVIAAVTDDELGCVRALVVRRGRLGLLGWSWRGGQALWETGAWTSVGGVWAHVVAASDPVGGLLLYVDGRAVKSFAAGELYPGRQPRQRLVIGGPVRFGDEVIPGWSGEVRHVALYDRPLAAAEVERQARAAGTFIESPAPEPVLPPPLAPVGCDIPAHLPGWRPDGHGGACCLQCDPPRGCTSDDHEPFWRLVGHDLRVTGDWWRLECALCETAALRGATHDPGEAS